MAELLKLKQIRSGHRTHTNKLVERAVNSPPEGKNAYDDTKILLATLIKKQQILEKCDGDILEKLENEADIGKEIEETSTYTERVIEARRKLELNVIYTFFPEVCFYVGGKGGVSG